MGNNTTKEGDVVVNRHEYIEKLRKYQCLEKMNERQFVINDELQREKLVLQKKIEEEQSQKKTIETEKLELREEIKKEQLEKQTLVIQKRAFEADVYQFIDKMTENQMVINDELQREKLVLQEKIEEEQSQKQTLVIQKRALEAEVLKYNSLPICKTILNINEQIIGLERDIKSSLNIESNPNQELLEEINKLRRNIDEQKQQMKGYLGDLPGMKTAELEELGRDLAGLLNNSEKTTTENLHEILEELEEIKEAIPINIQQTLKPVEKELVTKRAICNGIKNNHVDVTYGKIKNVLVEQENILLKHRLNMPPTVTDKNDDQKAFKNNEDTRQYNLIFINIAEECVDRRSDHAKIRDILECYFTNVSTTDIRITRLGRIISDKPRKIKVKFPSTDSVRLILRYKHKLKGGPFSHVRIFPDKPPNANAVFTATNTTDSFSA